MTEKLTSELKTYLAEHGCLLTGVAGVDRFPADKSNRDPRIHYRRAKSVVAIAMRVPFANATPYPSVASLQFGDFSLEHQLNEVSYLASNWLEDREHIAMPMPAGRDVVGFEVDQRGPEPKITMTGSFDLRFAAVQAGIGKIGANGLLISKDYGSRIRLGALLTSAELVEDPTEGWTEELPQFCHDCGFKCVSACPAAALSGSDGVDQFKCLTLHPRVADPEAALVALEREHRGTPLIMAAKQLSYASAPPHTCSTCTTQCPMDRGRGLASSPFARESWSDADYVSATSGPGR